MSSGSSLPGKSVLEILNKNLFSFSAEIIPPRNGTDFESVFADIGKLKNAGFDFISVTHGAGGSLRGGTLPIAHYAQNAVGLSAIAHLTCRNASREDLENSLVDHHYFGIHNILALRGDPPDGMGQNFAPSPGGYAYAKELVNQIREMNNGRYLVRKNFDKDGEYRLGLQTRFCIGVASYPEDEPEKAIEYLAQKKENGAQFTITQMIFDADIFENFMKGVVGRWGHDFPVLPGIRIPSSLKQIERMRDKFGANIPKELMHEMKKADSISPEACRQVGQEWAVQFIQRARTLGIKGIHLFIMGDSATAETVRNKISL